MPSITSWMRLEPRSRNAEMTTSLQARVYDPLWLLARQWQLGEFQGEDNGSPILARWRAESAPLTRYHSGPILPNTRVDAPHYDAGLMPLETLVERETVRPAAADPGRPEKLRLAAEGGQHFLRLLEQQPLSKSYRDAFRARFPFPLLTPAQRAMLDSESLNFLEIVGPRVPDGRLLYAALRPPPGGRIKLPAGLQIADGDIAEVERAAENWIDWWETFFSEPLQASSPWSAERMEYTFSVAARLSDGERPLTAQEYYGGHLDWYAFDANLEVSLTAATDNAPKEFTDTAIPAPVGFRGMPAPRFWEFEDARVDFGSVEAGPTDLARMLLVEFALSYGNDWFVVPVELAVGSLCRMHSFLITDTFGVRTSIKPSGAPGTPDADWRMFQLSHLRGSGLEPATNLFFLPPSLLQSLESRPVEEVLFLRDEMANLAWGIERLVESPAERPLNRFEAYLDQQRRREQDAPSQPAAAPGILRYRLATEVPEYWTPLMPVKTEKGLRLQRGAVLKLDGSRETVRAQGRVLEANQNLSLFEEEVPREGVRVVRTYQHTRWIDGSSHLWIGRRKGVGRGEGSSGLRFDRLENGTPSSA